MVTYQNFWRGMEKCRQMTNSQNLYFLKCEVAKWKKDLSKKNLSFVFKGQMTIEDLKGEISCLYIHLEN